MTKTVSSIGATERQVWCMRCCLGTGPGQQVDTWTRPPRPVSLSGNEASSGKAMAFVMAPQAMAMPLSICTR